MKFRNYDASPSTLWSIREVLKVKKLAGTGNCLPDQTLYGIIIASRAHNLCKSSKGLTLLTVSLVWFLHEDIILIMFAGLGSKHVPSTARRVGKIESNLDDRVDVITPKV